MLGIVIPFMSVCGEQILSSLKEKRLKANTTLQHLFDLNFVILNSKNEPTVI